MMSAAAKQEVGDFGPVTVHCNARGVYLSLLAVIGVLLLLSTASKAIMLVYPAEQYGVVNELCRRFYLDFENNVPAWFSTIGLFVSAALLGVISICRRANRERDAWHWLGLSILFLGLAIDEATYSHEILIQCLRNKLHLSGIFYFAWVIPGAMFVLMVGALYLPFLWRQPSRLRWGLVAAAALYIGGALGVELIGGAVAESQGFDSPWYVLVMTIEESLELLGIATLIYVTLSHLATHYPRSLRICIH